MERSKTTMKAQYLQHPDSIIYIVKWHLDPANANHERPPSPEWALRTLDACVREGAITQIHAEAIRIDAGLTTQLRLI